MVEARTALAELEPPAEPMGSKEATARGPRVEGLLCPEGHFNHPLQLHCLHCGTSLAGNVGRRWNRPPPPRGTLIRDDGAIYVLDCDHVIIDEHHVPGPAELCKSVIIESPIRERILIEVSLEGWDVRATNSATDMPVCLRHPSAGERPLLPGSPSALRAGTTIWIGGRTFLFESALGRRS